MMALMIVTLIMHDRNLYIARQVVAFCHRYYSYSNNSEGEQTRLRNFSLYFPTILHVENLELAIKGAIATHGQPLG